MGAKIGISKMESLVKKQVDKFNITEFCPNGGWPKFNNIKVKIFNIRPHKNGSSVDLEILYQCETPGCCFIPGQDNDERMRKTIVITNEMELIVS